MSDIFREVDEDIRHDRYKKLWDRWGPFVIAAALLVILGTAGYRGWDWWQERQAAESGDRFVAAIDAVDAGDREEAIDILQELRSDGAGGYPTLATFRLATELAAEGDTSAAIDEYDRIAASGSVATEIRNMARMRAALLLVDTATVEEVEERIGDLAGTGNPWRHAARELLGLTAWRLERFEEARDYFTSILVDQETPRNLRERAQVMLSLIGSRIGEATDSDGAS